MRGFAESGASVFLIDRGDVVKQVVGDLRGEGFDARVALADLTDEAQMVRAFAEIAEVQKDLRIIAINDLEHTSVTDFQRVLQLGWWTFTQLEAGLPGGRRHRTGAELLPGIDEADPPHPPAGVAAAIDRSRTLPQSTTWKSA